jgi:hypothetical protein
MFLFTANRLLKEGAKGLKKWENCGRLD